MSSLFSEYAMRATTLPNRIVVSPMCQYSAIDGSAQDWHLVHLGQLAMSGAGLLIFEATAVAPEGRITHGCLGLWNDANEEALARVMHFVSAHSVAVPGIQLAHAGRKASTHRPWQGRNPLSDEEGAWQTVSSSALPHDEDWHRPHAMSDAEMSALVDAFVASTERADRLGLEVIELHAAHGYLLHEFLSPLANQRNDRYGGSLENRIRFPLEVFNAVRARWPESKPIGVRVSATDWVENGWDVEQTVEFCRVLEQAGCDYIAASSGGISEQQKIELGEGYQVDFAARIRREADIATMAVGMIFDPKHADAIVADGQADMVALARGLLFDPHWPWTAAAQLGASVAAPPQYARAADFRFLREIRAAE